MLFTLAMAINDNQPGMPSGARVIKSLTSGTSCTLKSWPTSIPDATIV